MLAAATLGLVTLLIVTVLPAQSRLRVFDQGAAQAGDPDRGEYVLRMAGCVGCHTGTAPDSPFLAGGRPLETPFGTFYTPNITPDEETGIGGWTTEDFVAALAAGVAPDGSHYYPAFPYNAYARMTDQDLADLKAYLDTVAPVRNQVPHHDLPFPFNLRIAAAAWKRLFFRTETFVPDESRTAQWNRGAYLVAGPGHCSECHTPRNVLGALSDRHLAGTKAGPDGARVPNITPHRDTGIGSWSEDDITFALETGFKPDGDTMTGVMGEVVEHGTSHLTSEDLAAIAAYLRALDPVAGESSRVRRED